ncbi:MAG: hypothetical protein HZB16_03810 [Armatimonadetes bacterium]|nr:hypothetical protein [Armatimonadota bacterium]
MRKSTLCLLGWALAWAMGLPGAAEAAKLAAAQDHLIVDAGAMGRFDLEWPKLNRGGDQLAKPIEVTLGGGGATLKYDGNVTLRVNIDPAGAATYTFAARPAGVQSLRFEGPLDFGLANGGKWHVNVGADKPFPAAKPDKPFLCQDQAGSLAITDVQDRRIVFTLPPWSWMQLQDNREWGWKTFWWFFQTPIGDNLSYTLRVGESGSGAVGTKVLVDKFGQNALADFPGKVKNADELKTDQQAEEAWSATLPRGDFDAFGGLNASGAKLGLVKTGYFHVEQKQGRWYLVDPAGNAFFHLGLCGFQPSDDYTYVEGRQNIYEWLPGYDGEYQSAYRQGDRTAFSYYVANVIRKTGKPFDKSAWTASAIDRVRRWGFNSVGAFTGAPGEVLTAKQFPYVASLPLDPWDGGIPRIPGINETWDPYDDANRARVDRNFAQSVAARATDPLLIGYFLINEPAYEDIPKVVPTLDGKHACKRALVAMLRDRYQTIDKFNAAWELKAASFDDLAGQGLAVRTAAAAADMQTYYGLFLETYFKLVADTFHKYDSHHMLLGNRYQSGTINNEQLCRITGKYVDVMSFNYYTYYLDKDFLQRIHTWCGGKPMMLSEFHWSSPPDSGLPGGAKDVGSQEERGLAYRNYTEQAASTGYVVGVEWFTLIDQAQTGRWFSKYNGENGNTGVLSVADRPWKTMLGHMVKTNLGIYPVYEGTAKPFVFDNPRFSNSGATRKVAKIARATGAIKLDGTTAGWPGMPADQIPAGRLVQGSSAGGVEASFKLCWDERNLYLMANVTDPTPRLNSHRGDSIWSADGLELFIGWEKLDQTGGLLFTDRQVLLSGGEVDGQPQYYLANSPKQEPLTLVSLPTAGRGYILEAAIPWSSLGITPKVNQQLRFDLGVDDSTDGNSRRCQLMWSGTDRNSGDRGAWGTAVLLP